MVAKFIEGDAKTGGDAVMWANRLPHDALKYLLAQGASQGHIESDFDASLRVAQMVFDGVEHSADFFHQGIQDHLTSVSLSAPVSALNIVLIPKTEIQPSAEFENLERPRAGFHFSRSPPVCASPAPPLPCLCSDVPRLTRVSLNPGSDRQCLHNQSQLHQH